jgi:Na+/H+ antiporter NhaD/arsenite permease-like protein
MHADTTQPTPWMIIPFILLLACIALGPLVHADAWGRHYPKLALGLGAVTLGYYLINLQANSHVLSVVHEYLSFIILIGSLFVVSGGIHLTVKGDATPWENVRFLLIGGLAANLLGTTGASMLLIRPWIRMNKYRVSSHHIVFFIFVVANVGGCLTPIGDPPLFLGYLKGVPFWWVVQHGWLMWLTGMGFLLTVFFVVDLINYRRVPKIVRERADPPDTYYLNGLHNLLFLGVILGAVFVNKPTMLREALMFAAAIGSMMTTKKSIHESNDFNFHPIKEVAILFAGIFATMIPALDWLQANAATYAEKLGGFAPDMFYWGSGLLSSVLDNAPTYLSFLSAASGNSANDPAQIAVLTGDAVFGGLLLSISIGSVFFGANTYIGNGPNFMVKSIADQQKVVTPSFLGYIFKFTLPVMLPMLILVWLLYFRR